MASLERQWGYIRKRRRDGDRFSTLARLAVEPTSSVSTLPPKPIGRHKVYAVGAAAVAVVALLAYLFRPALPPPRITGYSQITHDGEQKSFIGQVTGIVLSDGPRLYRRPILD
jgi:hypothetical protein